MTLLALLACPVCAQQAASPAATALLFAFLAVPFAVTAAVVLAIRHVDS